MKKLLLLASLSLGLLMSQQAFADDAQKGQGNVNVNVQGDQDGRQGNDRWDNDQRYGNDGRFDGRGNDGRGNDGRGNDGRYANDGRGPNHQIQYDDRYQPPSHDYYTSGQEFSCGAPAEQNCGDCYCLMCKYEPCYYNNWRCEYEAKCCPKKCCRYVPKYYEKCCCKYVPQYYTQTCCRYCPEYYCVDETRYVKKWVCDRCCKYVPKYYYKHTCAAPCTPACNPCQ